MKKEDGGAKNGRRWQFVCFLKNTTNLDKNESRKQLLCLEKKYYEEGALMSVAEFHENPGIGLMMDKNESRKQL